jgi:hypothetical protein
MKYIKIFFVIMVSILFIETNFIVKAQEMIDGNDIFVEIIPETPKPDEVVKVTIKSYLYKVDELYIDWYENNQLKLSGYGKKNFQFDSGNIKDVKIIQINIKKDENDKNYIYKKTIVSKPSEMDLLWQVIDSYVPPFYKGKSLPTTESIVKIVSIPNFTIGSKNISEKNAIYEWKREYEKIGQASGYGKNTFLIKKSFMVDEDNIQVTATEPIEGTTATKSINIKTYTPKIIFYKKDPLLGINFGDAIVDNTNLSNNDTTLIAAPYFITPKNILNDDLNYTWSLNGSEINTPIIKNQLVLRGSDNNGTATLNLIIESAEKLFLTVKKSINITLSPNL